MTASPTNYHAVPLVQGHCSDVDDPGFSEVSDNILSSGRWISSSTLTRWTYFLLGCAILLPWNALVSGTPFFLSRLGGSPFYSTFSSYLSSVYTLTKLLCMSYCTVTSKQSSPSRRIFASTFAAILLVSSLCLSTFFRGAPSTFFLFALFNTALLAVTSSYSAAAVYAQGALLGQSFLQSVLSGQAAVGVVISTVQVGSAVISLWGLPAMVTVSMEVASAVEGDYQAEEMAARIFFGISALFLGMTLSAHTWLTGQSSYKSVVGAVKRYDDVESSDELTGLITDVDHRRISPTTCSHAHQILKRNWSYMFSIAYAYMVTLAVFPAITIRVQPVDPAIPALLFSAIHFLVFNVGDLVGRHACSSPRFITWSANKILCMSLLRTLFIPLVLVCNIHRPATTDPAFPTVLSSDILFMIIVFAMGYTNGFVACLGVLAVSSLEHNPGLQGCREDVDVAAALGGTSMMAGLAFGALCSFGVEAMI